MDRLLHGTGIEWTPDLIEEQRRRNTERDQVIRQKIAQEKEKTKQPSKRKESRKAKPKQRKPIRRQPRPLDEVVTVKPRPIALRKNRLIPRIHEPLLKEAGFVYLIAFDGLHKIGMTVNIPQRMRALERRWGMTPGGYTIVHVIYTSDMIYLEAQLHKRFSAKNVHCEWFNLDADDVAWIIELGNELDDMQVALLETRPTSETRTKRHVRH